MSNLVTALGLGQPSTQSNAGPSQTVTHPTYLRDGEKLWGTADNPAKRREDTSSKKFLMPGGCMLSSLRAAALLQGGGLRRRQEGEGATSRWPGRRTHGHPGLQVPGSCRSRNCVDEQPAKIWAAALLWAGCWCQTPRVERLGREVIRNSCTSRWFILTLKNVSCSQI
jgi:hypothetical protein